jgi:hypothetical protein
VKVGRKSRVLEEWDLLQWHENGLREDPRYLNDCADSLLYMYRLSRHFLWREETKVPQYGENGYWDHVELRHEEAVHGRVIGEEQKPWWAQNINLN